MAGNNQQVVKLCTQDVNWKIDSLKIEKDVTRWDAKNDYEGCTLRRWRTTIKAPLDMVLDAFQNPLEAREKLTGSRLIAAVAGPRVGSCGTD